MRIATWLLGLTLLAGAEPVVATEVLADEAYRLQQQGTLLIDIRQPEEWRETGIAQGALRIPMAHPQGAAGFLNAVLEAVGGDRDASIALICRSGNRSRRMQQLLQQHGFSDVVSVADGMTGGAAGPGWVGRGLPVEHCPDC